MTPLMRLSSFIVFIFLCFNSFAQYDKMRFKPIKEEIKTDFECSIRFEGYDTELLVDKKECDFIKLLGYTQPSILRVAPDLELIRVFASTSIVNKHYFIDLIFDIQSTQAIANYGGIFKDSKIKIHFLNGEFIYLSNLKTDKGKLSKTEDKTIFKAAYLLADYEAKMLKKYLVSDIEVIWSNGLEKYPVENIHLFKHQLTCLDK